MIMLLIVAAVVFAYYGGASCPKVLKDNKQMLLGVVVGLFLVNFMNGNNIEGFGASDLLNCQTNVGGSTAEEREINRAGKTQTEIECDNVVDLYNCIREKIHEEGPIHPHLNVELLRMIKGMLPQHTHLDNCSHPIEGKNDDFRTFVQTIGDS